MISQIISSLSSDPRGIKLPNEGKVSIVFDAIVKELIELNADLTRHPIEDRSDITDHVRVHPERISIDAIISDTPVSLERAFAGGVAGYASAVVTKAAKSAIPGIGGSAAGALASVGIFTVAKRIFDDNARAKSGYASITEIWKNRVLIDVQTGLTLYRDMVITRLSSLRTYTNGNTFEFSMTIEKVKRVEVKGSTQALDKSIFHSGKPQVDLGAQQCHVVSDSTLASADKFVKGLPSVP